MTPDQQTKLSEALNSKEHLLAVESFDGTEFSVKARSCLTGQVSSMVLEITEVQLYAWAVEGMVIQNAMSNLSPEEREFLMTGIRSEEWDIISSEAE
jgi:hypothetical protein